MQAQGGHFYFQNSPENINIHTCIYQGCHSSGKTDLGPCQGKLSKLAKCQGKVWDFFMGEHLKGKCLTLMLKIWMDGWWTSGS